MCVAAAPPAGQASPMRVRGALGDVLLEQTVEPLSGVDMSAGMVADTRGGDQPSLNIPMKGKAATWHTQW